MSQSVRMMINHSTLDYHVTKFNTFFTFNGYDEQFKTPTLYSDLNSNAILLFQP